jgi:Sec-independent protein translocase protein TatA
MADGHEQTGGPVTQDQPSDEDRSAAGTAREAGGPAEPVVGQRAAYEAELNRITSSEMILQTAVSLLNIGGRRLGLTSSPAPSAGPPAASERDLEQVRDAIDGASALLPILERRMPRELGPLRDAIAQLQVAYAREAQSSSNTTPTAAQAPRAEQAKAAEKHEKSTEGEQEQEQGPGPAQSSGRLWVPGR